MALCVMFSVPLWLRGTCFFRIKSCRLCINPTALSATVGFIVSCDPVASRGATRYSVSNLYPTPYTEWINSTFGLAAAIFFRSFLMWLSMVRSLTVRWS